ncbi:MAG: DUF3575 domain-containing protein [Chitinophagaceae bacterium]|nr:MAG: DUF3575 domain-containing protein [Chitinophagaceae bacterium]
MQPASMKNTICLWIVLCFYLPSLAQETPPEPQQNISVKWAPTGLLVGSLSLQAEYNFGERNSLTAKIGLPVNVKHTFTYDDGDVGFSMKATSFLAGYRTYLSKKHMRGFYFEPFFKYVHHTSEGVGAGNLYNRSATFSFTNNYNGVGVGVQLGTQFLIGKRFVLDLFFLGPEINSATNSFKATEILNPAPWSNYEAKDAEMVTREFIAQFPFVRKNTTVVVDRENKRIMADFKGALPGLRTGFSIGYTF